MTNKTTGAEKVRWDLSPFYFGINDPKVESDLALYTKKVKKFKPEHKGKLSKTLGKALKDYSEIKMLEAKLIHYPSLLISTNLNDEKVKTKLAFMENTLTHLAGEYLVFFELELIKLNEKIIKKLCASDPIVKKHKQWIEYMRSFKKHILSEEVESALTKRSPFGPESWSQFFDEFESDLEFTFKGEKKTMAEMLHIFSDSPSADDRFSAMTTINSGLKGIFAKYSAQNLYMVTGSNAVEDKERSYKNPMTVRNKSNRIPDAVVETLHSAVLKVAGPLAQRYYKLKAAHLGLKTLKWSDKNAPMPFSDEASIPFDEATKIVLEAYGSFSQTLADLIRGMIETKKIDAPAGKGKINGAFNSTSILPGNIPVSYTLLNYLGSSRDVMTLAHELGHGVHGLLAGREQGTLMSHAPTAYCETASVFGEMTTFNFLKEKLAKKGDKKALLALVMAKIDDILNTSVRQIGFSNFERRIHGMDSSYSKWNEPKKLSVDELGTIWLETLKMFYGKDGDVFTYENTEYLWAYIGHFHRPFYVYGYAFGEFLTQSIYAKKAELGEKFEQLYLDMLKSGMTKDVVGLLKPFNLDPNDEKFWIDGINAGLGEMIKEAEDLSRGMRVSF